MKLVLKLLGVFSAIGVLAVFFFLTLGVVPRIQDVWVMTAMTTMNHKWLATSIIAEDKIAEIMKANYVDDSGKVSKLPPFVMQMETSTVQDIVSTEYASIRTLGYVQDGYEEKSEGVYIKDVVGKGYRGKIMMVSDPTRVYLVDTSKQYQCGETVKEMVERVGGVAGVNGGGFSDGPNYDSNGGTPAGIIIKGGKLISPVTLKGTTYPIIGLTYSGALLLRYDTAEWALENDVAYAVGFKPFLIVNGEGTITQGSGGWGIAPRTAIGQRPTGELLFLCIDGRQPTWSIGVDLKVLQDELLKEGCINAAMLDGGSSTVMYHKEVEGGYVNRPSLGHERKINNCFVVM